MTPPFLLDALNLAYWRGSPPSLRIPLSMAAGLLEKHGRVRLIFDASTRHRLSVAEQPLYERVLEDSSLAMQVPSGEQADRHLLQIARQESASIISRDRFRDHRRGFVSIIHNPQRLMDGWAAGDTVHVPVLELTTALYPTAQDAWQGLASHL